jgi:hypothetical protein
LSVKDVAPEDLPLPVENGKISTAKPAGEVSFTSDQSATKVESSPDQLVKIVQQATINSYKGLVSGKGSGTYRLTLTDRPDEKYDFDFAFDSDKFNLVLTDGPTYHHIAVSDGSATILRWYAADLDQGSRTAYILRPGTDSLRSRLHLLPNGDLSMTTHSIFNPKGFETFSIKVVSLPDGRLRGTYDINKFVSVVFEAVPESGYNICRWEGFNKTGGRTGTICTAEWKRDGKVWYVAAWTRVDFRDGVVQKRSEVRYNEFTANPKLSPELFAVQRLNLKAATFIVDLRPGPSGIYSVDPKAFANKAQKISEQVESLPRNPRKP